MATTFIIDQTIREALTPQRATHLLHPLTKGVQSVKLSGKSFGDGSAEVAAQALTRALPTLTRLDISDIIASRPEEEAKRTLSTISSALASCKTLTLIDLSDNALGAKGIRAVGDLLTGQTHLEELLLCNNGLAADAGHLITTALTKSTQTALTKLHFHNNLLETAGCVALAPIVDASPHLTDFRFSSLRLGREGAVRISRALQPRLASTLAELNMSDNTFGEEGAAALAEALADAPALVHLNVRDAMLGDDGVKAVCRSLAKGAPKLQLLDLSGNEMGAEGARALAKLLASSALTDVLAEDNELGSSGAVRIAGAISVESSLERLILASSEIGSRGALALAKAAAKVSSLKELGLNGNSIGAEVVAEIEELLGDRLGSLSDNDDDDDDDEDGDDDDDDDDEEDEEEEEDDEAEKANGELHSEVDDLARSVAKISM